MGPGGEFTVRSKGFTDLRLGIEARLLSRRQHEAGFGLAFFLPTGASEERDTIPGPGGSTFNALLPRPGQLGFGAFVVEPKVWYRGRAGPISWGGMASGRVPLTENDTGFEVDKTVNLVGYAAYAPVPWVDVYLSPYGLIRRGEDDVIPREPLVPSEVRLARFNHARLSIGADGVLPVGTQRRRFSVALDVPLAGARGEPRLDLGYLSAEIDLFRLGRPGKDVVARLFGRLAVSDRLDRDPLRNWSVGLNLSVGF